MIRIDQEALQRSGPAVGQTEQDKQDTASTIDTVSSCHNAADIGLPRIGRTGPASSSKTLCTHRPSFSTASPSDQSIITIQRSPASSNEKPSGVPSLSYPPNCPTDQCSCAVHLKSSVKDNDVTAIAAIHIEDVLSPTCDLSPTVAPEPPRNTHVLAENAAQPLQLSERREKHKSDARIQNVFQHAREEVGNDMDTDWWLKLATWWFVKVGPTNGNNTIISHSSRSLLTCNSHVRFEGFWHPRIIIKSDTMSRS